MLLISNGTNLQYLSSTSGEGTEPQPPKDTAIYGVTWDGSSSSLTRTDDSASFTSISPSLNTSTGSSPFDNISPWKDMNITKLSNIGVFVPIPKFYYKLTQNTDNSGISIKISMTKHPDFEVSPAHCDRGDGKGERDIIYISRYLSAKPEISNIPSSTNDLDSVLTALNKSECRTLLSSVNTNLYIWDFLTLFTLWLLYLVESAKWSSQELIGYGGNSSSSPVSSGYTAKTSYHTGSTYPTREQYVAATQYRNIEGLWENVYSWVDGVIIHVGDLYINKNPLEFSDTINETSIQLGRVNTSSGLYPTKLGVVKVNNLPTMFLPSECDLNYNILDRWNVSDKNALTSGNYNIKSLGLGLLSINSNNSTQKSNSIGLRMMYLP